MVWGQSCLPRDPSGDLAGAFTGTWWEAKPVCTWEQTCYLRTQLQNLMRMHIPALALLYQALEVILSPRDNT